MRKRFLLSLTAFQLTDIYHQLKLAFCKTGLHDFVMFFILMDYLFIFFVPDFSEVRFCKNCFEQLDIRHVWFGCIYSDCPALYSTSCFWSGRRSACHSHLHLNCFKVHFNLAETKVGRQTRVHFIVPHQSLIIHLHLPKWTRIFEQTNQSLIKVD